MKTLVKNISYNLACSILDVNKYGVTDVNVVGGWVIFYKGDKPIARYNEARGVLQVPQLRKGV